MGHHIEYSNPHLLERAKAFIKSKAGDRLTYVNFGERNKAEFRVRADVSHYYMSKIYVPRKVSEVSGRMIAGTPALSKAVTTEVFSMAMQCYADQDVAAKSIINGDGIIEFLLGCLKEIQHAG